MENKYYTPEIEEFYIGFEFEYKVYKGNLLDKENVIIEWIKCNDLSNEWDYEDCSIYAIIKRITDNEIRVKYLDKKDIESLGYNFISETITDGKSHLFFKTDRRTLTLFPDYTVAITHYPYVVQFHGKIKNKSELIKLLKQLDI